MLHQQNIMELMLRRIKYNIIFVITIFFLSFNLQSQIIDSNIIAPNISDTTQIIHTNDSLGMDTLVPNTNESSFYENYVEPIIAVLSAALVTILLFSVRSKK